ncbi:MAG: PspC domain-containing protein [Firmicutes bacterium]|nr:PspC domain-containing protein [Bacillota bacterium]
MSRLYRSRSNRVIAGVAGGVGEYFNVDPVIVRLLLVLLGVAGGNGVLLYLIAWILIPEEPILVRPGPDVSSTGDEAGYSEKASDWSETVEQSQGDEQETRRRLFGGLLLLAGLFLLVEKTSIWFDPAWLVPGVLIAAGLVVLVRGWR